MYSHIYNLQSSKNRHFTAWLFFLGGALKLIVSPSSYSPRQTQMRGVNSKAPSKINWCDNVIIFIVVE